MKKKQKSKVHIVDDLNEFHDEVTQSKDKNFNYALAQRKAKLGMVFENSIDAIGLSKQGLHYSVNQAYLKLFGISNESDIVGKPVLDQIAPSEHSKILQFIKERQSGEDPPTVYKTLGRRKDGTIFHMDVHASPCNIDGDNYTIVTLRDISEQKEAEQALQESKDRFQSLVETTSDWIWEIDRKGNYTYVSPKVKDLLGYEPEEVLGKTPFHLMPPEEAKRVKTLFKKILAENKPFNNLENINLTKNRETLVLETSGVPIFDQDGHLKGYRGIDRDITERKQFEEELQREKKFTEVALNAQTDTFFIFEISTGKAIHWNESFRKLSGYNDTEIESQKAPDSYYNEEDLKKVNIALKKIYKEGKGTIQLSLVTKEGKQIPTEYNASVIKNKAGKPRYIISVGRNITERNQAEEALRQSEATATAFLNAPTDSAFLTDLNGIVFGVNEAATRRVGKTADELIGTSIFSSFPPDVAKFRKGKGLEVARTKKPIRFEDKRAGRWYDNNLYPITNNKGDVVRIAIFARDITERKQAQKALQESQERFRMLSDSTFEGIGFHQKGKVVDANKQLAKMLGVKHDEIVGMDLMNFIAPQSVDTVLQQIKSGSEQPYQHFAKRTDGTIFPVEVRGKNIPYKGETIRVTAIRDITERKQSEEAVRESEEKYRLLFENMTTGFALHEIICDDKGKPIDYRYLEINPAFEKLTGVPVTTLLGKTVLEVMPNTEDYWIQTSGRVALTGEPVAYENYSRELGKYYDTYLFSPRLGQFAVIFTDITERKQAELQLRESEERFRAIFDHAAVGFAQVAPDGHFLRVNQKFCEILGYSEDELIKKTFNEITVPDDLEKSVSHAQKILSGQYQTYSIEKCYIRKNGSPIWCNITVALVRDNKNQPKYFVSVIEDITERRQAQEEIYKLNTELEERVRDRTSELELVIKELESFSYSVSHDLRTPLRGINSFGQVLIEDYSEQIDEQGKDYLHRIRKASLRMSEIIDNMLNLARITRSKIVNAEINLSDLAQNVFKELKTNNPGRKVKIKVESELKANGDSGLIQILLENLLGNAWKFTEKQPKAIIEFGKTESKGTEAFFVKDNGAGFDMQYANKLFAPFHRLHNNDDYEGTGIGLTTVQRVVRRHSGTIWAEAEVGKGATFYFTLAARIPELTEKTN